MSRPRSTTLSVERLESRDVPTTLPFGFTDTRVVNGLSNPTSMAVAPDGRIFVCQQGGALRVIKDGQLLTTPFLNLTVNSTGERGLLGVAFDPNFAANNFVYVYYTATDGGIHNRVSRFTANGDVAVGASELQLMNLETLSATNHNGGALHFGTDGMLYVATGENAVGANSQSLNNRLGKMLRINSDGSIPGDNPFVAQTDGVNEAIWAIGLRNPFTFAVNRDTGRMFINDVGQSTFEEINDGIAGSNYGWPTTEGPTGNPNFRSPIFAYPRTGPLPSGIAITGGVFYTPTTASFPASFAGQYFFADLGSDFIFRLNPATNAVTPFASDLTGTSTVDLDVTADGDLLYLSRGGSEVRRIRFEGAFAAGSGGSTPQVAVYNSLSATENSRFLAFDAGFPGGVRVAMGDVTGDGVPDLIAAAGPGGGPHVKVFDGVTRAVVSSFFAFPPGFGGGVNVATGDIDGDGRTDIITAAGAGGSPHVRVFSGATGAEIRSFLAYGAGFSGGVNVAAGDVNNDGRADIVTGVGPGGGPHVKVISGTTSAVLREFFAYDATFTGGVYVSAGETNGDGFAEIVTGTGANGGPHARVFDGQTSAVLSSFFAFSPTFTGGVRVAAADLNGDGRAEIITAAGPTGAPHVRTWRLSPFAQEDSFLAFDPSFLGGVFVG